MQFNIGEDFEVEYRPGIYLQKKSCTLSANMTEDELFSLQHDFKEIHNSVLYLISSNVQLEEALREDYDRDFEIAIEENKLVIAKKKAQLEEIQRTLANKYNIEVEIDKDILESDSGVFI